VLSGGACWERRILSFLGGARQLRLHSGVKSIVNLGVYEGKVRKEVFFLHFQEARATREGGDSSRAQLFLCWDI
jgi:hypothetical protein